MRTHSKLILAALAATMLLAAGVSTATAGRYRLTELNHEDIWNTATAGKNDLEFSAGSAVVKCPVTLLGTWDESTIKKETLIRQGLIPHASVQVGGCEGGTATIRQESLPWESRYRSFGGPLPAIKDIVVGEVGVKLKIREANGLECEAATEANHPGVLVIGNSGERAETGLERTGEPEDITAERANGIPLGGGFLCSFGGEGHFSGVGLLLNLPRTRKVEVTLI